MDDHLPFSSNVNVRRGSQRKSSSNPLLSEAEPTDERGVSLSMGRGLNIFSDRFDPASPHKSPASGPSGTEEAKAGERGTSNVTFSDELDQEIDASKVSQEV